jgi:hypothetical protein
MNQEIKLPPLPEASDTALVEGFQGSEYRRVSEEYDPKTARFSERQLQAYATAAVELDRAQRREPSFGLMMPRMPKIHADTIPVKRELLEQVLAVLTKSSCAVGYESETAWLDANSKLRAALEAPPPQPERKPMTDEQIEKLREATFSTGNPYCQVDSKSMRKAVRAVEAFHGITEKP